MKTDPFSKENPFKIPDGYFDSLQDKVMSRIREEEQTLPEAPVVRLKHYRTIIAIAACFVLIFTAGALFWLNTERQPLIADSEVDDDTFYQWLYEADKTTLLAEALAADMDETVTTDKSGYTDEEEQEIIRFLERDNITVAAIVHSMSDPVGF